MKEIYNDGKLKVVEFDTWTWLGNTRRNLIVISDGFVLTSCSSALVWKDKFNEDVHLFVEKGRKHKIRLLHGVKANLLKRIKEIDGRIKELR